jgi:diaminopimelate epimerase
VRFAKYHGIGNDFVVVDLRDADPAIAAKIQDPAVVKAVCDRRFGVGGDGVLAILPSTTADVRMRVLNADGSEAEMCGNGIRCVAKELHDRGGIAKNQLAIDTGAGRLICAIHAVGGVTESVTVAMGAPRLTRGEIPMTGPANERCIDQFLDLMSPSPAAGAPLEGWNARYRITCVSMGNPHAISFAPRSAAEAREHAESYGPTTETHPWFPNRTNAEFAHVVSPTEIDLVVWERGCGITLACGTGACATVVAAILTGRCKEGDEVTVRLPGGALSITVLPGFANVMMRGPATLVYDGDVAL